MRGMIAKIQNSKYKVSILIFFVTLSNVILAQGYVGLFNSNFSGISGAEYNPAFSSTSRFKWDVRLVGLGVYAYQEYFFLKNESAISILSKKEFAFNDSITNPLVSEPGSYNTANGNSLPVATTAVYDFFDIQKPFNNIVNLTVQGPGVLIKKDNVGFGLFTNFKMTSSTIGLDKKLSFDTISQLIHNNNYSLNPMQINIASYSEIGFNFSHKSLINENGNLSIGINAKLLLGHDAFFLNSTQQGIYFKNKDTSSAIQGSIEIGYSTGISTDMKKYNFGVQGVGAGFDIGAQFTIPSEDDKDVNKIKIAFALKDIGWITYTKNAAIHQYSVQVPDTVRLINAAYKSIVGYYDLARVVSYHNYGDSTKSLQSNTLTMGIPLSFMVHFDYGFTKNIFVQAMIQRRINVFEHQIQASNLVSITPRFESKWFEFGIPINVVEDNLVGVGAYIRLAWITIGSDHLNTILLKQNNFQGTDIYMNIRIFPFEKKENGKVFSRKSKKGRSRDFGCFF
jgi:hypothetical protein